MFVFPKLLAIFVSRFSKHAVMTEINYMTQGNVTLPALDETAVQQWIVEVAQRHGQRVGCLTYVFCDDEYILVTNREFLGHDFYTDIITFDYTNSRHIAGDMVISLDTVLSNSEMLGVPYETELMRVMIHGVLHLCGINDKGPGEREIMEKFENEALAILPNNVFKK